MNEIDKVIETLKKMQEISQREVYKYMIDDLEKAKIKLKEKKVTISESEFEKAWDESLTNHSIRTEIRFSKEFYSFKDKLFGRGEWDGWRIRAIEKMCIW